VSANKLIIALDELDAHRRYGGLPHATGPAREELEALLSVDVSAVRSAVVSEVREKLGAAFARLRDADDHYDGEAVRRAVLDVLESM